MPDKVYQMDIVSFDHEGIDCNPCPNRNRNRNLIRGVVVLRSVVLEQIFQ
jgi:hypothetical protein